MGTPASTIFPFARRSERSAADDGAWWSARPLHAALVHLVALGLPTVCAVAFAYGAASLVRPTSSQPGAYFGWWAGLSLGATAVLATVARLSRRLLPLAALLRISLFFPDNSPSRFRIAMASGTVGSLQRRLAEARRDARDVGPAEAIRRLLVLVRALDTHDPLTRGHSERVRAYSRAIGRELGLKGRELELLNWAALLHDVGKLDVPTEILAKDGRPTPAEWDVLRRHPEHGEALVAPLRDWLGEWCDAVGQHHERWDGTGYPNGKVETEISLAGRIVAVADAFDVITSSRSYKRASTATAARAEIARCAGTHFDPEVVRAFLAVSLKPVRVWGGAIAWLAQAPILARIPLGSAAGSVSALAALAVATAPPVSLPVPLTSPAPTPAVASAPGRALRTTSPARAIAPHARKRTVARPAAAGKPIPRAAPAPRTSRPGDPPSRPTVPTEPTAPIEPAAPGAPASPRPTPSPNPAPPTASAPAPAVPEPSPTTSDPPLSSTPDPSVVVVAVPSVTVTVPPVPPITVPSVPDVSVPSVPPISVPQVPDVQVPSVPSITVPAVTVTIPPVPSVAIPPVPTM